MNTLKENGRYQAIVDNLEEQSYTVHEESTQVVKGYIPADYASVPSCIEDEVWSIAFINMKTMKDGQVENIVAFVCIDKGKVLLVQDAWGTCLACAIDVGLCGACLAACSVLGPFCIVCLMGSCPWAVGDCCACLGCPWPCPSHYCS